jgi:hypothetical protein
MDVYGNKKALDELSKIYLNLDEISADTALAASKKADVERGKAAVAGDKERAKEKAAQASRLYKKQADKRLNREQVSNWRDDLKEVISDREYSQSVKPDSERVVKEKNVKNKVVIDPEVKLEAVEKAVGGKVISVEEGMTTAALEDNCPECGEARHEGECVAEEADQPTLEESILWDKIARALTKLGEMYDCQFKVEGYQRDPEGGEEKARQQRRSQKGGDRTEKVRGERTPMPPRGNKRREDFERWYAANVR